MRREILAFDLFRAVLFATAMIAVVATSGDAGFEWRRLAAIGAAWAVALAFQAWLYGPDFLSRGVASPTTDKESTEEQLRIGPLSVPAGDGVKREEGVIEDAVSPFRQLGVRLGFGAVLAVFVAARVWLQAPLAFHDVIFALGALLVVPAMGMNHFLVPLALSALAMIVDPASPQLTGAYLLACAAALVLYQYVELAPDRPRAASWDERILANLVIRRALRPACVLAAALVLANCLIPGVEEAQKMFSELARALNAVSEKTVKYAPEAARLAKGPLTKAAGLAGMSRSQGAGPRGGSQSAGFGGDAGPGQGAGQSQADGQQLAAGKDATSGLNLKFPSMQTAPSSARPIDPEAPPPAGGTFNENGTTKVPNLGHLDGKMPRLAMNADDLKKLQPPGGYPRELSDQVGASAPSAAPAAASSASLPATSSPSGALAPDAAAEKINALTGADSNEDPEAAKARIAELARQLDSPGAAATSATTEQAPARKPITEAQLRRLAILMGLVAVVFFLGKLKSSRGASDVTRRPGLTRKRRRALRLELEALRGRSVDARDEILASYRYYLRFLGEVELPREEWLPVEDFQRDISARHPRISAPSTSLTAAFCDVHYGRLEVSETRLREFRSSLGAVLRYFS